MKVPIFYLFFLTAIFSEVDLNYNYEYEKGGVKTKFSDWVPYKLHKWNPKFLEDYYELYGLKLHYGENELRRDIGFLKTGLNANFRHPTNALCKTENEKEYHKYRLLVTMHINLQIMRAYMRIASLYDKRHLYFQNLTFAHDLKKSFTTAESIYKEAIPFWEKALDLAKKADEIKREIDLGTMESERYEIVTGKLHFGNIIGDHIKAVRKKIESIDEYLKNNPEQDHPPL